MTDSSGARPDPAQAPRSGYFRKATTRASGYLGDRDRLHDLVDRATRKSEHADVSELGAGLEQLKALARLVRAYASGQYRQVRRESLVLVVAGLLYFVSPVDLIPDFLPGGFLDDAAVLAFILRRVNEELERFLAWESDEGVIDVEIIDVRRSEG